MKMKIYLLGEQTNLVILYPHYLKKIGLMIKDGSG